MGTAPFRSRRDSEATRNGAFSETGCSRPHDDKRTSHDLAAIPRTKSLAPHGETGKSAVQCASAFATFEGPREQEEYVFFKLRLRTFWIVLLVLSSLWVADVFGPVIYSFLTPKPDFQDIVHALEGRGTPPPQALAAIQGTMASAGLLRRAIQIGYYDKITGTFQLNASHTTRKTQLAYVA